MLGISHEGIQQSVRRLKREGCLGRRWEFGDREATGSLTIKHWGVKHALNH